VPFLRRLRRRRVLRRHPLPQELWSWLLEQHPILKGLSVQELARLRQLSTVFAREKVFETSGSGLEGEELRGVIAVQACLPVLNLGLEWYDNWKTVVLLPEEFTQEHSERDQAGVVHEWKEEESGLSWDQGPVVLSSADVEDSGWGEGYNVVIHEAAHRLDMTDGALNGRPALHEGLDPRQWEEGFRAAFEDLQRRSRRRRPPPIDAYAAESAPEFFAVASEYFFETPNRLKGTYPEVYRLLSLFYRQDPSERLTG
jgi:Mlc titration factor MtfA (ptsG expression regulator)